VARLHRRRSIPGAPCGASGIRASSLRRLLGMTSTGLARPTPLALCVESSWSSCSISTPRRC